MYHYSKRIDGDMRKQSFREKYVRSLGFDARHLVLAEQLHTDKAAVVTPSDEGKEIPGVDALVTTSAEVILGIRSADCVPLLFFDSKHHVIGAAHAGWKGTAAGIVRNVIHTMIALGGEAKDIQVSIGPHIGSCCYSVPDDRAAIFARLSHPSNGAVTVKGRTHYVDLGNANYQQLEDSGILRQNIDTSTGCTSCQHDHYFSFRKDTKETFGEMMGIISLS